MTTDSYSVYQAIVDATSSELIVFFVIVAVAVTPLYIVFSKHKKTVKKMEIERQGQVLDVVKQNTAIMHELKTVLEVKFDAKFDALRATQIEVASKTNKILMIVDKIPSSNFTSYQSKITPHNCPISEVMS